MDAETVRAIVREELAKPVIRPLVNAFQGEPVKYQADEQPKSRELRCVIGLTEEMKPGIRELIREELANQKPSCTASTSVK